MSYPAMHFSSNPNGKLFPNVFQDVRIPDEKYTVGNIIQVFYRNQPLGFAKVLAERSFPFNRISDTFSYMNCGKHAAYQASIINSMNGNNLKPDSRLQHVVLCWTQRDHARFEELLTEWWNSQKLSSVNS